LIAFKAKAQVNNIVCFGFISFSEDPEDHIEGEDDLLDYRRNDSTLQHMTASSIA
jgi:hypothetical protein